MSIFSLCFRHLLLASPLIRLVPLPMVCCSDVRPGRLGEVASLNRLSRRPFNPTRCGPPSVGMSTIISWGFYYVRD